MGLFDNTVDAGNPAEQTGFSFPASLTEKYRPHSFADFIGIDRPRRIMENFAKNPKSDAFLFVGPSGIGKTSLALAFAEMIGGELHHIPSQKCNVDTLENIIQTCHRAPCNFYVTNAAKPAPTT